MLKLRVARFSAEWPLVDESGATYKHEVLVLFPQRQEEAQCWAKQRGILRVQTLYHSGNQEATHRQGKTGKKGEAVSVLQRLTTSKWIVLPRLGVEYVHPLFNHHVEKLEALVLALRNLRLGRAARASTRRGRIRHQKAAGNFMHEAGLLEWGLLCGKECA